MKPEDSRKATNTQSDKRAFLGGVWVPEEAYEYHAREISKLVKERDKAEGARDIYKYLCIGLGALILICKFLDSFVLLHPD
jgi:tRNA A37 threonylcarbamoyltransferase TsaD